MKNKQDKLNGEEVRCSGREKNRKSTNKHLAHSLEKAEKYELLRFKIESIWHFCSFDKHDGAKFRIFVSFNIVQGSNEC